MSLLQLARRVIPIAAVVAVGSLFAGCSKSPSEKVAGGERADNAVADARRNLVETAKKMEGAMAEAVVAWVENKEQNPEVPWSMMDEEFSPGKFTPETIAAYKRWRAAMIASPQQPKLDSRPKSPPPKGKEVDTAPTPGRPPGKETRPDPPVVPKDEPVNPKAWLREVARMDLHLLFHEDRRAFKDNRHLVGNASEAEKAKSDEGSYFKYDKPLGYSSSKPLPGAVALWRKLDPKTGGHTYYKSEAGEDKKDDTLGWVWTQKKPGLVEVFAFESLADVRELQPANLFLMTTKPDLRDKLLMQGKWKLSFTFFLIDPDEK
jgi:hypothetical protein